MIAHGYMRSVRFRVRTHDGWMNIGFKIMLPTDVGGDIINATNCSSDKGLARVEPRIRSEGMMPLGNVSCVAEASHSSANGFNFRFVSRVRKATRSPNSGRESTTCVAYDSVSCFCTNPKQAVGNRRGSASAEEFHVAFL